MCRFLLNVDFQRFSQSLLRIINGNLSPLMYCFAFVFLVPLLGAQDIEKAASRYWYNDGKIRLLPLENRGLAAYSVKKAAKFTVPVPLRPPVQALYRGNSIAGREGNLEFKQVAVELLEEAGDAGISAIRFGFPFSRGAIFDTERIRVMDATGKELPAQFSVLGLWDDQSLKWVLVQFDLFLQAGEKTHCLLECGNRVKQNLVGEIQVTELEDRFLINSGRLTAELDKKQFNILKNIVLDGQKVGSFAPEGFCLRDATGQEFTMSASQPEFAIIEQGGSRLTIRVRGFYTGLTAKQTSLQYTARMTFEYNKSTVRMEVTHVNAILDREFSDFNSLGVTFQPAEVSSHAEAKCTESDALPLQRGSRVFQETDEYLTLNGGDRQAKRLNGGLTLHLQEQKIDVALAECWQRWPKAFSLSPQGNIVVELLPEQPHATFNRDLPHYLLFPFCEGKYRLKWGMAFTEKLIFDFAPGQSRSAEAEATMPVIAVLPPSWYRETAVFPGARLDFTEKPDQKFIASFRLRMENARAQREFGYLNYGDGYGERETNWANNEYDLANILFLTFIRTGERDLFRWALTAARHCANVDTVHAYPDPFFVGGQQVHTIGHTGNYKGWSSPFNAWTSARNGHTWVNGIVAAWQLYGEAVTFEAAAMTADHIAFAQVPNYPKLEQTERSAGWPLRAVCTMYLATYDPVYLKAAKHYAMLAAKACKADRGGAWPHPIYRLVQTREDNTEGNTLFMTGILLSAICDYAKITGDPEVLKTIDSVSRWMLTAYDHNGGFDYDCAWNGQSLNFSIAWLNGLIAAPLGQAAALTGNPEVFQVACQAMGLHFLRGFGFSAKGLAISYPYAGEFYQAVADWLEKNPGDDISVLTDEERVISSLLTSRPPKWCLRGPSPREFLIRFKAGAEQLRLRRYRYGVDSSGKTSDYTIRLIDVDTHKSLYFEQYDPAVDVLLSIPLNFSDQKEHYCRLLIEDGNGSDWNVESDGAYFSAVPVTESGINLSRIGFQQLFFESSAQQPKVVHFIGTHPGWYGMRIYDANGNLLKQDRKYKSKFSMEPETGISFTVQSPTELNRIVFWADSGGILRFAEGQSPVLVSVDWNYFVDIRVTK